MPLLDPLSAVTTALQRHSIIPDVLPATFFPSLLFSVVWPNGREAILGTELPLADVQEEPSVQFMPMNMPAESADSTGEGGDGGREATYTLAMLDPDAPSRQEPLYKSFRHWVVCYYSGCDGKTLMWLRRRRGSSHPRWRRAGRSA